MNNITIELCKEDRDRLDIMNKALAMLTGQLEGINTALEARRPVHVVEVDVDIPDTSTELPQEAPEPVEEVQPLPITVTVLDEPQEAETEAPVPNVTKNDIQQKVIELVGKGKKAEVRNIITTYADNVSGLPDSTLNEVWARLTALEG